MSRLWTKFAAWLARQPRLIDALIAHCKKHPYFHIYEKGDLYMARFWLVKERPWLPFAIRLHEWHRPDKGRDLHDHPRDFRTIILRGWYIEQDVFGLTHLRSAGDTTAYRREHMHTVVRLTCRQTTYSLFIYWGKSQMWGFLVNGRKVPWKDYIEEANYPAAYHEKRGG